MSERFDTIIHTLTAAVADAGTFTLGYPEGTNGGMFLAYDHEMNYAGGVLYAPADFTVAFGASEITVTNATGAALAQGEEVIVTFFRSGDAGAALPDSDRLRAKALIGINLGAPDAADTDGVCASQAVTADATINGALASGGVATFDVPRNVVAAWTTTAVLTVTGTDEYGETVVESSASGTSLAGKKAFKTVTAVSSSTAITGCTVGTGDVLGLPVFVPNAGSIIAEFEDGADATAGTPVAGATAEATATTGDVRGTYDPNSAANGTRAFELLVALDDPNELGVAQYAG